MAEGFFTLSEVYSKAPVSRIAKCGICQLLKTCKSPKMPVDGEGKKKILIVGEAPGSVEDKYNKPFVGPTGQLLERTLHQFDIDLREDCWITNSLICRPPDNKKPSSAQISYCQPNLIKTVEQLKPEIIVPLGEAAAESVISWLWKDKVGKVGRWVGWQIPVQKINAWVCPAWHPSYIARSDKDKRKNPEIDIIWKSHLKSMSELSGRPWKVVPDYKKEVEMLFDIKEAARRIDSFIEHGGTAAFDYETNCLKPEWDESEIVCCSICWEGKETIAFPWHGAVIPAMKRFVRSKIKKIASNAKFEERWTRRFLGVGVKRWWWDTMIGAHLYDNRRATSSIKFQSFVWLGAESYNEHIKDLLGTKGDEKINRVIKEVDLRQLLLYCGLDSLLEYHTTFKQRRALNFE